MKRLIFALVLLAGCQPEPIQEIYKPTFEDLLPGQYERFFLEVDILEAGRIEFESFGAGQFHKDSGLWQMESDSTFSVRSTENFDGLYKVISIDQTAIQLMTPRGFKEWFRTL